METSYIPEGYLNVAALCPATRALGPGLRAGVWVQGCPFHCLGCIAPDWLPQKPARVIKISFTVEQLTFHPNIVGLTISGGEPMLQARNLAAMCRQIRKVKGEDFTILCFTGYRWEDLQRQPRSLGWHDLVNEIDTLLAGPFLINRQLKTGLLGSNNKQVIHFTPRLEQVDFHSQPRTIEVHIQNGEALMVGVPGEGTYQILKGVEGRLGDVRV